MNGIIHPHDLQIGDNVKLYRWADFRLYSREEDMHEWRGVLVQKMRNDNYVIQLEKGYTECWTMQRLMVAMNEPILKRFRVHNKSDNPFELANKVWSGDVNGTTD